MVRSLHNPFGDGHNVITVGGSDFDGDRAAVERFAELTAQTPSGKFGWLADLKLGDGLTPPADAKDACGTTTAGRWSARICRSST